MRTTAFDRARRGATALALAIAGLLALASSPALATFPGENGQIVFEDESYGVSAIQPDVEGTVLRANSIHDNRSAGDPGIPGVHGLGFDLLDLPAGPEVFETAFGVNENDPGDGDAGPDGFQNYPVIATVEHPSAGTLHVVGTANGEPGTQQKAAPRRST